MNDDKSFHVVKGSETLVNYISCRKDVDVKDVKSVIGKQAPNSEQANISYTGAGEVDGPARVFINDFLIKYFEGELKEEPIGSEQPKDTLTSAMDVLAKAPRFFISFQRTALFARPSLGY